MAQRVPSPVNIAKQGDFSQPEDIAQAIRKMRDVPDHELHQCILGVDLFPEWGRAAGLSQAELQRRSDDAAEKLAMRTTWWSAGVGAAAAIVGAIVGAWLQSR